ncbi:MAG: S8 family peptidase, partial [Steroidobacteraceae bacterium]
MNTFRSDEGMQMSTRKIALIALAASAGLALALVTSPTAVASPRGASPAHKSTTSRVPTASYIVQAQSLAAARAAVVTAGGNVTHELGIIDAVGATLTLEQLEALRQIEGLEVQPDAMTRTQGGTVPNQYARQLLKVDALAAQGFNGTGVTVAILDTGIWYSRNEVKNDLNGTNKIRVMYDAVANKVQNTPDQSGHGSHVASIIGSPQATLNDQPLGIAPMARLVAVKAFDVNGQGSYANVIRGLDWIRTNKATYNIRVLNLSFGATPQSFYWNDPLAKAVMKLWQAGVVVVASAGNWGPNAQSITVPGNVPYVITVGAMTDNYTPTNGADDRLASFSSAGPTYEGFVKPEIVAPGGHMPGKNDNGTMEIPKAHPQYATTNDMTFTMSGTSQSAAVVSGVVALMLQAQPTLTPNQVKCKLMSSARP